ncbi:MAG: iron-sulfur cluster assembly scaffold protein [Pirellulaceae bacterium]|jgi:nitrogen fixation NifU-like protein|nr:iron-sulfur cluster assembly scaffold protein [Pirellulaceae bacterium]
MCNYQQTLHDHYLDPHHRGPCDDATHAAMVRCNENNCQLEFELSLDGDGIILQAWFEGDGCQTCEGLASMLANTCEGQPQTAWTQLSFAHWCQQLGWSAEELLGLTPCCGLPLLALQAALRSPLDTLDDDLADGTSFGGPSLREEC